MGGKTGTTKQSVSIPPEVMARYNAVNAYASDIAKTPFQGYQGQFVAGLTPTQQAGIQATSQYSQSAQPYYQAATGQLYGAQQSAMPGMSAAYQNVGGAQNVGQEYAQAATGGIGAALEYAQPFQQGATQAAMAGAQQLTPENINIQGYMSPYTQAVADTTYQALRQQQQQEMAGQTANAIRAGAFGGDRAGLVAANLARQQQLGTAQAMAPIYQQGYSQALGAATNMAQANRAALQNLSQQLQGIGQQGYGQQMGAAQQLAGLGQQQFGQGMGAAAQLAGLAQQGYGMGAQTAQQLAALGTGAQQSALQGAQAQLGAGTLEQQTQQADLTAQYQQFLQERGYPFQVAQFLANIAMGTGALSGQTTTTTQPMPFFSDRRVKEDVKEIGETHDGQPIYSFKYKGDDATRIGLMAQDVEKKHPEAVYDMGGVKGVDYKQATESAERPERYEGGLVPASMGGAVTDAPAFGREGYAFRGGVNPSDLQQILAQQREAMGPYAEGGIYGVSHHESPFGAANAIVPKERLHIPSQREADTPPPMPEGAGSQAIKLFDETMAMKNRYDAAKDLLRTKQEKMDETRQGQSGTDRKDLASSDIVSDKKPEEDGLLETLVSVFGRANGGVVPRHGYALGAYVDPYEKAKGYFPEESLEESGVKELKKAGETPQSTSQTGLSLGDAASLAKTFILPFFLKDGGLVPRDGYQRAGFVEEEAQEPKPKGVVPRSIRNNNPGNIKDSDFARRQPGYVGTDGVFARFDSPESGTGAMDTLLTSYAKRGLNTPASIIGRWSPQADPENAPGSTSNYANYVASKLGVKPDQPIDMSDPNARSILRTAMAEFESGVKPSGAKVSAPVSGLSAAAEKTPSGEDGGFTSGLMNYLKENQAWLSPFGAGIRGMVQSKSPFLGGALLEGIGTGLEAVTPTQRQIADIGLTKAQAEQTMGAIPRIEEKQGIVYFLVRQPDGNYGWVNKSQYKPEMGAVVDPALVPKHQVPPAPADAAPESIGAPKKIEAPKIVSSNDIGQLTPDASTALRTEIENTKEMNPANKNDFISPAVNEGKIAIQLTSDINTYGAALSMVPKDSMAAGSVISPLVIEAKKTVDQILDQFGIKDYVYDVLKPDLTGINFAEEVQKLKGALTTGRAGEAGQRAVSALDKFGEMFPDITTSEQGRRDNTASILVRNMQDAERGIFAQNWRNETGRLLPSTGYANNYSDNMNYEFERATQDQYRRDKAALQQMFETRMDNGQTWLYYLTTLKQPLTAEQVDFINQKFKNPAILRYFPNIKVQ